MCVCVCVCVCVLHVNFESDLIGPKVYETKKNFLLFIKISILLYLARNSLFGRLTSVVNLTKSLLAREVKSMTIQNRRPVILPGETASFGFFV